MDRARLNILLLAASQALFMSSTVISITFGALTGYLLAEDKAWATLPIAMMQIGAGAATIPASFLMRRWGRRLGFIVGALSGSGGGLLGAIAIFQGNFILFCAAYMLLGVYRAFAQYYRYAAIDSSTDSFRAQAISYVLAGGVVAGVTGPQLAIWSKDLLAPATYAGAFVVIVVLGAIALLPLSLIRIPKMGGAQALGKGRSLAAIIKQPSFIAATLNTAGGYALMTLVMAVTPLSMVISNFEVSDAALVIQWHVIAMFIPSFFTGGLISRFGLMPILTIGMLLFVAATMVALSGMEIQHFTISMILVGVAWNFCYVGGTTLLVETYTPAEQAKTQAINEFLIFAAITVSSLSSGNILEWRGWDAVNYFTIPVILLIALTTIWYAATRRRAISETN